MKGSCLFIFFERGNFEQNILSIHAYTRSLVIVIIVIIIIFFTFTSTLLSREVSCRAPLLHVNVLTASCSPDVH